MAWRERSRDRAIVAGVLLVLGLCLWTAVRQIEPASGPLGEMIPHDPPDESRRVQLTPRLSMVVPRNWVVDHRSPAARKSDANEGLVTLAPRWWPGRRRPAMMTLEVERDEPDLREFQRVSDRLYETMRIERAASFDDPARSVYRRWVAFDGGWVGVTYVLTQETTTLPPVVRQYVETVQCDPAGH